MGWAIALHGGAGVDPALSLERQQEARDVLLRCLNIGVSALKAGLSAIDVVELVVRELETDPVFNSGRGSALTAKGTVEMEAGIMDGFRNKCGAVSGISTVKNPVSLARLVMDKSPHVYLGFDGAEEFARQQGVEIVDANYFITPENVERLEQAQQQNSIQFDYRLAKGEKLNGYEHLSTLKTYGAKDKAFGIDPASNPSENGSFCSKIPADPHMNGVPIQIYQPETVGCVAVDLNGHCAAATSTGGLINKMHGRIGDSPLIGAGTYANGLCAVSATGEGEALIRATVGRDVAAVMEYKALSLRESVDFVINKRLEHGKGGVIAISCNGEVAAGFNCIGMFRACATEDGYLEVGIWE